MRIRLATRVSPLALWQARHVAGLLLSREPNREVVEVGIETTGDKIRDKPLGQIGGDGLFTKEIQDAILDGRADAAVHSLKDLPTTFVPGLRLAAVPKRGPTGDAFISRRHSSFEKLPLGATVGTSSIRRKALLLSRRPDLNIVNLRGNVDTRLRKLTEQNMDAIVLAEAGLVRLGLGDQITGILDGSWMFPAVGQGAIGIESSTQDSSEAQAIEAITDRPTYERVLAERSFLLHLGGGCLVPIGVNCSEPKPKETSITINGVVLTPDGKKRLEASETGPCSDPVQLGLALARKLISQGAGEILGL